MTTTVVTEKNNTVVIQSTQSQVVTQQPVTTTIITGIMGPPGSSANLSELGDVDVSTLNAGSVLVYNSQTQKWNSTTLLDQQIVDSGQY
jgi:hypothetical protein